jgi:hypothetical protein
VTKLVDGKVENLGYNQEEFIAYIKLLNRYADKDEESSVSGIAVCIDEKNELSSYQFNAMNQLALAMKLEVVTKKEIEQVMTIPSKKKNNGLSL